MDDLVTWLREQIAVTKTWAREALDRPWLAEDNYVLDENGGEVARFEIKADARHAALNEPRAVLAQCEANTALLDSYAEHLALPEYTPYVKGRRDKALHDIRLLALAYQHRPGYREEWR